MSEGNPRNTSVQKCCINIYIFGLTFLASSSTFAAGAGLPWEAPLQALMASVTGPVAQIIGALSIVVLGLGFAFSEGGSAMRKALWVVFGLALTYNAVNWGIGFMGWGGGVAI